MKRPTTDGFDGSHVTTPLAAEAMTFLGAGTVYKSVAFTPGELRAIEALYGFKRGEEKLHRAAAVRNALREAESDGLRLLAWVAKYASPGEDPLKAVIRAASAAGWDVAPEDLDFANEE